MGERSQAPAADRPRNQRNFSSRGARHYPPRRSATSRRTATLPDVEAHITGTVWKIEVQVGDSVEEGDAVVILESMKMEMPVEAEDPGVVKEILLHRRAVRVRGRHARCPRVAPRPRAPGAGCWSTSPRRHVARLTISNPGKRGALDHAILDALRDDDARARRSLRDHHRRAEDLLGRLRHRRPGSGRDVFADEAEKLVAHPFAAAIDAIEPTRTRPWRRSTATPSEADSSWPCPAICGSPQSRSSSGCRPRSSGSSTPTPGSASSST